MPLHPSGSIVIPGDLGTGAAVFDQDGTILALPTLSRCEMGDMSSAGVMALGKINGSSQMVSVDLYDDQLTLITSVLMTTIHGAGFPFDGFCPIRANGDLFYVAGNKIGNGLVPREVKTIDLAGAVGATTWTLGLDTTGTDLRSMAVNRENTRLYYTLQQSHSPVYAHDLENDLDLGVLVPSDSLNTGLDIFVLDDGDLLVSYGFASADSDFETRRYNAAGVLQATYPLITDAGAASPVFIAPELGHPDVFWSRSFVDFDGFVARYDKWSITSATITDTFDLATIDGDGDVPLSCPMLLVPFEVEVSPGGSPVEEGVIGPLVWVEWPRLVDTLPVSSEPPTPPSSSPGSPGSPIGGSPIEPGSPGSPAGDYGPIEETEPVGAIEIAAGANIQAVIDAHAAGSIYWLRAGYYRGQTITPKNGDEIWGDYGATLTGGRVLSSWIFDGTNYYVTGQTQGGTAVGFCAIGSPRCGYAQDVFFDDVPLAHVSSLAGLASGKYFFDYAADRIYIRDNPSGHVVETSVTSSAVIGSATGVTLRNIFIEKYACNAQQGAVAATGADWSLYRLSARHNHGLGVRIQAGWTVQLCALNYNGQMGIGGSGDGAVVEQNEIAYNNYAKFDFGWEAGGSKFTSTDGLTLRANWVHHNDGPGLWNDINVINALIEDNLCEDNAHNGIFHEISYAAIIRDNTSRRNHSVGFQDPDDLYNPYRAACGMCVAASPDVELSGNVCEDNDVQIAALQQDRSGDLALHGPHEIENLNAHHNTVRVGNVHQFTAVFLQDVGDTTYFTTRNNHFENNIYDTGGLCGSALWAWANGFRTFSQWQALSNDDTGVSSCS